MKNIKPKKVRLQKVVKVKPVKQTNIMKGSTKLPDTPVSGSKSTGRIKIKTKAPKASRVSIPSSSTPPISISTPKTPSQGYVKKPKPEKEVKEKEVKEKVVKERNSSVEKRRESVLKLIDNKEKVGHSIPDDIKQKVVTSNSVTELGDISKYIRETFVKKRGLTPEEKLEKKRQDLFTMVQKRKQAGVVLPNDIMDKIDNADIAELSDISKDLQNNYRVRSKSKATTNKQNELRNKVNSEIYIMESLGVKVPESIKADVLPIYADKKRVQEVFKMLGGKKDGTISQEDNVFIKVYKENKFLSNVGLPTIDMEKLSYAELKKLGRKSSDLYMKAIKGDESVTTRIRSPEELNMVIRDIIANNPEIARKQLGREKVGIGERTRTDLQKLGVDTSEFDDDTGFVSVADELTELYAPRIGIDKKDITIAEIYNRLKTNESIGYQLSDYKLGAEVDKWLKGKWIKDLDTRKAITQYVKQDKDEYREQLKEANPELSGKERQKLVNTYGAERRKYYEEEASKVRQDIIEYVRDKMQTELSKIKEINNNIDPHYILKNELNKVFGSFIRIDDKAIKDAISKLQKRYGYSDEEVYKIEKELRNIVSDKLVLSKEDLSTYAQISAIQTVGTPEKKKDVARIIIDKFTDRDRLEGWNEQQIQNLRSKSELKVSIFLDAIDACLHGHPSWEMAKALFYEHLFDALNEAISNGMSSDELEAILAKHTPEYADQLYLPEYAERWVLSLFGDLGYTGNISDLITTLKSETGWSDLDLRRGYWTGAITSNPATSKDKSKSKWKKG